MYRFNKLKLNILYKDNIVKELSSLVNNNQKVLDIF